MPKYRVTMSEVVVYVFEVESESVDTVAADAEEAFVHCENASDWFSHVDERNVVEFELIGE